MGKDSFVEEFQDIFSNSQTVSLWQYRHLKCSGSGWLINNEFCTLLIFLNRILQKLKYQTLAGLFKAGLR